MNIFPQQGECSLFNVQLSFFISGKRARPVDPFPDSLWEPRIFKGQGIRRIKLHCGFVALPTLLSIFDNHMADGLNIHCRFFDGDAVGINCQCIEYDRRRSILTVIARPDTPRVL